MRMQHTARRTNGILHRGMHDYYNVQKRGKKDMGRYKNLIDEQLVKGWDNLPRGKILKEMETTTEGIQDQTTTKGCSEV